MDVETSPPGSIRVEAVCKTFPKREKYALAGVDLRVDAGRVCTLLGANGAGKTTLVRILTTLTGQDSGAVSVNGWDVDRDPARARAAIGVVGQYAALDAVLSARENLELFARPIGLSRTAARSRTAELLEPTTGLDPIARRTNWNTVRSLYLHLHQSSDAT